MYGLKRFSLITISFFLASTLEALPKPPVKNKIAPKEILFGNPDKRTPQLSPDGTKIAFLAPDKNNVLNVWVQSLEIDEKPTVVTFSPKRNILSFCWEYDGEHILHGEDKDGDENYHLYETDIQTLETVDLTPYEGITSGILSYLPEYPKKMLINLNLQNPSLFDVYELDLDTKALSLVKENKKNISDWFIDNQLQVKGSSFFDREGETVIEIYEEDGPQEFLRLNPGETGKILSFSKENKSLYLISDLENNTAELLKIDLKTKKKEVLAKDPSYDIDGNDLVVHPTTHEIQAIGIYQEKLKWIVLDQALQKDFEQLEDPKKEFRIVSRDLRDKKWIVMYSAPHKTDRFYLYDRASKQKNYLFTANSKLEKYSLSKMNPISFKARDGMQLHGYLTLPIGGHKNLPTVLFVHGGPWVRDLWKYNSTVQWLAGQGYAVLQINYRGSTGYGKQYLSAGNREWGGKMHTDLLDGKQWLIEQGIANPQKVAIFGGSYGGYAALVGSAFTPNEFCCAVDIVGPSNLVSLMESFPPYWNSFKPILTLRVGNVETEKEFLMSRSPLFKVDQICNPLLIAQGANDPRVKQAESDQIVKALKEKGKDVEYLLFEDEGHGFNRIENRLKFVETAEKFLEKYLKGK